MAYAIISKSKAATTFSSVIYSFGWRKQQKEKWRENERRSCVSEIWAHERKRKEREYGRWNTPLMDPRRALPRIAYLLPLAGMKSVYHAWKTDFSCSLFVSVSVSTTFTSTFRPIIISINNIKWLSIWNYLQHSISSAYLCMNIDIVRTLQRSVERARNRQRPNVRCVYAVCLSTYQSIYIYVNTSNRTSYEKTMYALNRISFQSVSFSPRPNSFKHSHSHSNRILWLLFFFSRGPMCVCVPWWSQRGNSNNLKWKWKCCVPTSELMFIEIVYECLVSFAVVFPFSHWCANHHSHTHARSRISEIRFQFWKRLHTSVNMILTIHFCFPSLQSARIKSKHIEY